MEELLNEYNNMATRYYTIDPYDGNTTTHWASGIDPVGTTVSTPSYEGSIQGSSGITYSYGTITLGDGILSQMNNGTYIACYSIMNHGNRYNISSVSLSKINNVLKPIEEALDRIYELSNQSTTNIDIAYQISNKFIRHIESKIFKNRNELQQIINGFLFDEFNKNGSRAKSQSWIETIFGDLTGRQDINQPFYQILTGTTGMRAFYRAMNDYYSIYNWETVNNGTINVSSVIQNFQNNS